MLLLLTMLLYLFVGFLFMGLSIPLIQRKVKPNPWYGFRTPKTLSDPEIWYPANEYSGKTLFLAGMLMTTAAILFAPLGLIPYAGIGIYTLANTTVILVSLFWSVLRSFRYLRRL